MRSDKPSLTSTWVAALRGLGTVTMPGIADDPVAVSLVPEPYALFLRLAARNRSVVRWTHALARHATRGRVGHMTLRARAIDDAIQAALIGPAKPRQLVILGAGLDARAHRLPGLGDVTVFEVDHPATQSFKRRGAGSLPLLSRALHYVSTNFEGDDLTLSLKAAGHDASAPSVFVWEGVVMYLSGAAVDATLEVLRARAAPGSTLAVTYVEPVPASGGLDGRVLRRLLGSVREPVRTDWTPADARRHLGLHGFEVTSDESDPEWSPRFVSMRTAWSFERLAVAVRR